MISHCQHGFVQQTLHHLQHAITSVCAPLSTHEAREAVLSSEVNDLDSSSLMQTIPGHLPRPIQRNAPEGEPNWYPQQFVDGDQNGDESDNAEDQETSGEDTNDSGDHDNTPPNDPVIQPPAPDETRQSVLLYHMNDIPIHTMLHWINFETMMREVAHHFAIDRVDLLDCHDMTTMPADMPIGTIPLIVQFARDLAVGEPSVLVMIDVIVHAQEQEPHFHTAPRVRRSIRAVPIFLLRQALLIQLRLFEYCRFEHLRCLIKHEGNAWPLQEVLPRQMQHGNYLQVIVLPPLRCEVPTQVLIADSQTMEIEDFWDQYYIPTPPSVQEGSEESEGEVSPSLISSEEIRREFGNSQQEDDDDVDFMQRSQQPASSSDQPASSSDLPPEGSVGSVPVSQMINDSGILGFNPYCERCPLWFRALATCFGETFHIEADEEGPVAYLTTWYADCNLDYVSEESRTVRLDSHSNLWAQDIQHAWRDKIQRNSPVHFAWVFPTPVAAPTVHTIGHLIVFQNPNEVRAPVLMSFQFRALTVEGTTHAVVAARHGIAPPELVSLVKLDRVCGGMRCTLHRGRPGRKWYDAFVNGEGIKLVIPAPGEYADQALHWSLGAVVLVYEGPIDHVHVPLSYRLEDQPTFVQELHKIWKQRGEGNAVTPERFLEVTTWYVDGTCVPYNDQSRKALLGDDFTEWIDELRRVWQDRADATEDIDFAFVQPTPPSSPLAEIHILLYQQIDSEHVGLIVTKYDNAVLQGAPYSTALVCERPVTLKHVLKPLGKVNDCSWQGVQCTAWHEGHELTNEGSSFTHGVNIQVHIYRQKLVSWASDDDEVDEVNHMQHTVCPVSSFNVDAAEYIPGRPFIATLPEHMQDLHALWETKAFSWEGEERKTSVQTWYLNPGAQRLRSSYCRKVHLFEDYMQWERLMKQAWTDELQPNQPVFFFIVQPTPVALEHDIAAHILLVQEPTLDQVASLVTIFDSAIHQGHPFRIAVVTHEHITQNEILERVGYAEEFRIFQEMIQCTFQHSAFTFPIGTAVPGRDGDNIVMMVQRSSVPNDWNPPFLPVAPGMEGIQFLQRDVRLHRTKKKQGEEPQPTIQLDMQPAIDAFEWLDTHFTLLSHVPPLACMIPFESLPWIELPIWEASVGGQEVWIYFDGSFQPHDTPAGLAIALFIKSDCEWFQAGFMSTQIEPTGSYTSELHASMVAAKAVHDLLKTFAFHGHAMPAIWFCYDSITVGNQLLGHWQCLQSPFLGRGVRMMIDLVEARFGVTCQGTHVRSHRGEPGNELVDALAKSAASGHATHDLESFFKHVLSKAFIEAGEWMWALFASEYVDMWQGTCIVIPARPTTSPSSAVLTGITSHESVAECTQGQLRLSLATGNVLTLKGNAGPTRQSVILQQLHDAGITIFALQETRLRKVHLLTDPNYLLFHSPATEAGHYGVLVGFNARRSHGHWKGQDSMPEEVFFQKTHISIIARDPRFLILRVRSPILQCILIAAHAPHTGANEADIESWWTRLTDTIPPKYHKWDRILLADANARIGTFPSSNVGTWQAESDSDKSEYFVQFLQNNDLWVPATFEEFQKGEGGTWRHNQGMWLRNDYVALPCSWKCQELEAFVSDEVDLSTVKEDHALAVNKLVANITPVAPRRAQFIPKRSEEDLASLRGTLDVKSFWMPWDVDVHTHAHELHKHLLRQLPKAKREWKPLKTTITDQTWTLVKTKKFWRNQMWENTRVQKLTWLKLCFDAWNSPLEAASVQAIRQLQQQQDHLCATAFGQFRSIGRQVVQAMRRDDAAFFDKLARQASELTHPNQAREFWSIIRRSLPKMKAKRQHTSPMQLESLEDQWHPYFQDLEAGLTTTPKELVEECVAFQQMHASSITTCQLTELPSRAQLVNAFRSTTPHKATGLDPLPSGMLHRFPVQIAQICWSLFMKIFAWQQEPIQAKGGILAVIPKKQDMTRASHFRGIMLLPSIYKRLHAVLREQVINIIAPLKPAGQIGGFQGQQVQFGSMSLQCFSRIAHQHNLSMGVVFVDLANAFHRLIRELVCGISRTDDVDALLQSLEQHGCPTEGVSKWLEFPCLLQRLGAPARLVNLLRDVHTHTWHVLSAHPG